MSSQGAEGPELNVGIIAFPFDRVAWGKLRATEPDYFSLQGLDNIGQSGAASTHFNEVMLAKYAFEVAKHGRSGVLQFGLEDTIAAVNDGYRQYGISSGMSQTRELVKAFMAEAKRQAKGSEEKSR